LKSQILTPNENKVGNSGAFFRAQINVVSAPRQPRKSPRSYQQNTTTNHPFSANPLQKTQQKATKSLVHTFQIFFRADSIF